MDRPLWPLPRAGRGREVRAARLELVLDAAALSLERAHLPTHGVATERGETKKEPAGCGAEPRF